MNYLINGQNVNIEWEQHDIIDTHDHEVHWAMIATGDNSMYHELHEIGVIGNIYEHPHLLNK